MAKIPHLQVLTNMFLGRKTRKTNETIEAIYKTAALYGFKIDTNKAKIKITKVLFTSADKQRSIWYEFSDIADLEIFLHGYFIGADDEMKVI